MTTTALLEKRPRSQVIIRFQDCDLFGHLNNAQYIQYFINAREDHLRTYYDFDLYRHSRDHRENWVITNHEIAYLRPAFPGELVTIETGLLYVDNSRLKVEGVMLDEAGTQLKAVQWTTFRYVSLQTGRPARHSDELAAFLHALQRDDADSDNMTQRIRQIKQCLLTTPAQHDA